MSSIQKKKTMTQVTISSIQSKPDSQEHISWQTVKKSSHSKSSMLHISVGIDVNDQNTATSVGPLFHRGVTGNVVREKRGIRPDSDGCVSEMRCGTGAIVSQDKPEGTTQKYRFGGTARRIAEQGEQLDYKYM